MQYKVKKLDNNLRIATYNMPYVDSVAVSIWVKTGSRRENEVNSGISHFLEHMAFKGTKTKTAKQIAESFDDIGSKVNAFTSREATCYHAKVLKENLNTVCEILADILQNSTFPEEELEKEREVILQEIAMTNDTPDDIIFDHFQETAFPNQPIGRPILGRIKNVKSITSQDLKNYVANEYRTGNIVISFAGKITEDESLNLAQKYFGNFPIGEEHTFESAKYEGGLFHKQKDLEQVHMVLGFDSASYNDKDFYTINILASILGGGMSSKLFQKIREEMGLVYSIYSFLSANSDSGVFNIYAGTTPENAQTVIKTTTEELLKATKNITSEELKRAISQYKASILMSMESNYSMSRKMGSDLLCFGKIKTKEEILDELNSINIHVLHNSMERTLSKSKPTIATIGNVENAVDYDKYIESLKA